MATNTTWMNNASDPGEIVEGVINGTNGAFIISLEISLFFIVYVALRARGHTTDEILIYQGALHFIILTLAIAAGWVAFSWLMYPVVMLFAGVILNRLGG